MIYKSINSSHSNYNNDIKEKPLKIYYEDKYQVLVTDRETDSENKGLKEIQFSKKMTLEELLKKYEMSIKKEEFDRIPEGQVKELLKEYITIEDSKNIKDFRFENIESSENSESEE